MAGRDGQDGPTVTAAVDGEHRGDTGSVKIHRLKMAVRIALVAVRSRGAVKSRNVQVGR